VSVAAAGGPVWHLTPPSTLRTWSSHKAMVNVVSPQDFLKEGAKANIETGLRWWIDPKNLCD
jgi:hypothetical protein